jgi:hypothetical protein
MIGPRHLTAVQWANGVALTLSTYGVIPKLASEESWKAWAETMLMIPVIAAFTPPDPRPFTFWRDWAERFIQVVTL